MGLSMSDETTSIGSGGVPTVLKISSTQNVTPRTSKDAGYEKVVLTAWRGDPELQDARVRDSIRHEVVMYSVDEAVMHGRLVHPKQANGCGVVIVHTAVGPHDVFLHWKAESLAALGYTVLIADLLGDEAGLGWDPAWNKEARQPLTEDRGLLRKRARASVHILQVNGGVKQRRIAAIGYCFGGLAVLDLARLGNESGVKAVVSFHGILDDGVIPSADMSPDNGGPRVLICHGDADPFIDSESRAACEAQLRRSGALWDMIVFGRVRHGFTNPAQALNENPAFGFDERAAAKGWTAMRELFEEVFKL